jgi:hypothetical protein
LCVLRRLTGSGRVLVAVDDVQWLDRASENAVAFAARRLEGVRIAFLVLWTTQRRAGEDWLTPHRSAEESKENGEGSLPSGPQRDAAALLACLSAGTVGRIIGV